MQARRTVAALDSIEKACTVPKPALDMIRRNMDGGTQGMQAMARAFGFGGGASVIESGNYLVSMTVDGQTQKQVLCVERRAGGGASGFPFEVEEMFKAYDKYLRNRQ